MGRARAGIGLLDPVPRDIATDYAAIAQGVPDSDLPPWTKNLMVGLLCAAIREVPVSADTGVTDWMMINENPGTLRAWADVITPLT